jgi:hypothetical protein
MAVRGRYWKHKNATIIYMSMESFPQPENLPNEPEKVEEQKEQILSPLEKENKFKEMWMSAGIKLGYVEKEDSEGNKVLEKDGQSILLIGKVNSTGNVSGFAKIMYEDNPVIKPSSFTYQHNTEISEAEVEKTLKTIIKTYEKRYDKQVDFSKEEIEFVKKWISSAEEAGFVGVKNDDGRATIENDKYVITLQHLPYRREYKDSVRAFSIRISKKGQKGTSTLAFEWEENQMDEIIKEQLNRLNTISE